MQIFVTNRVFKMFKIGLENRDFCKSLHFYIVDAGKKKKKKKKKKKELHLLACSAALGPSGRGHHYFLIVLRGACQRPDIYIFREDAFVVNCVLY